MKAWWHWLLWVLAAGLALQLFFVLRIAALVVIDPQSTAFMRSEAWRLAHGRATSAERWHWSVRWVDMDQISPHLQRAVMASEDAGFLRHSGVDWSALQSAWDTNAQRRARLAQRDASATRPAPKLIGGSTITQQLAKNLLLSGERTLLRKGQELLLSLTLELFLSKRRILEIYLNSVEWGEGIFGAEAAAQHYFKKPAARLSAQEAARLAVMLPSPKFFQKRQNSAYLARRTATIVARMSVVTPP